MYRIKAIVEGLRKLPSSFPAVKRDQGKGKQPIHGPQGKTKQINRGVASRIADAVGSSGAEKHDRPRREKTNRQRRLTGLVQHKYEKDSHNPVIRVKT